MALSPATAARRYAPLVALLAVQLALVFIAPSTPPGSSSQSALQTGSGYSGSTGTTGGSSVTGPGSSGPAGSGPAGTVSGPAGSSGTTATGGAGGTTGAGTTTGTGGGGGGGSLNAWGYASHDMSHCDAHGWQVMPTSYPPACKPVWHGGNNGGATMTGVTATQVRYLYYASQANAQVNAILAQKNLATTNEQLCEALQAFTKEVNKRFELYGRKLVSIDGPGSNAGSKQQSNCSFPYWQSNCSLTPPDPPCYVAEADAIANLHPAFVIAPVATQTQLLERLAQDHVVVFGGSAGGEIMPESYLEQLAPYWWNVLPNGTQTIKNLAEYYCKKLADKPVQFAGPDVMTWNGVTAPPPTRKVAIIYPENGGDPIYKANADLFAQLVNACGSKGTLEISYASDINTAQQQSDTTVAELKQNHITTVTEIGDPIAPVFFSETADHNNYHPEVLISGTGYIDYDVLGQLYDPNVWRYAFGPSALGDSQPFAQSDAVKAWNDVGNSGQPGGATNVAWSYMNMLGNLIQDAGPRLTIANVRAGATNAPFQGGDALRPGIQFVNPFPWTGEKDFREVYYCPTQTSQINGSPGAYMPVDNGRRYRLGQWTGSTGGLFPGGPCAG